MQPLIVLGGSIQRRHCLFCNVRQYFLCIPEEHCMFKNWRGQVALVSGAGSEHGIGLAIAKRLGDFGAKLIITGSSARIHDRVAQLSAEGYEVEGRAADLTQPAQVGELVTWAESLWGRIDVLVNNAGMAVQGEAEVFYDGYPRQQSWRGSLCGGKSRDCGDEHELGAGSRAIRHHREFCCPWMDRNAVQHS